MLPNIKCCKRKTTLFPQICPKNLFIEKCKNMHKSFSIIIVDISLHKKWGELKFLLDFNAIDRTKEGTLRETFAFQQFHKKHRFSSSVHSLKHNCDTQCTVSVKMLLMWMLHTVVNLANPTSMNWKLILTQNQISCVKLQHGSQSSSPDWLWGFFFFSDQQRKLPHICHCGYLPTVILPIIPIRRPVDTGKTHLSKTL